MNGKAQAQPQPADLVSLLFRLDREAREHKKEEFAQRRLAQEKRRQYDALRDSLVALGIILEDGTAKEHSHHVDQQQPAIRA